MFYIVISFCLWFFKCVVLSYDGKTYLYRKNARGDVIALLDIDGNIVVKYVYDAWGNHVVIDDCGDQVVGSIKKLNVELYNGIVSWVFFWYRL